jgi:hypothetical protein
MTGRTMARPAADGAARSPAREARPARAELRAGRRGREAGRAGAAAGGQKTPEKRRTDGRASRCREAGGRQESGKRFHGQFFLLYGEFHGQLVFAMGVIYRGHYSFRNGSDLPLPFFISQWA